MSWKETGRLEKALGIVLGTGAFSEVIKRLPEINEAVNNLLAEKGSSDYSMPIASLIGVSFIYFGAGTGMLAGRKIDDWLDRYFFEDSL